jgi:SAM-dependent methyltransferase
LYDTTAFLYDATAAFEKPDQVCDELESLLARCGIQPPALLADLGAGTGVMSIRMAERGWCMQGIECSAAMLAVAAEKTAQLPLELQARLAWQQGDITRLRLPPEGLWDAAICLCNTINHLSEWSQVEAFLQGVFQSLRPQGVLILDSDTQRTFQDFFNHPPTVVWDDNHHRLTRACRFDESTGLAHHQALLEQSTLTGWHPVSEESMTLCYHPETRLHEAFLSAGFELGYAAPFNPSPILYQKFTPKVLWLLRKP